MKLFSFLFSFLICFTAINAHARPTQRSRLSYPSVITALVPYWFDGVSVGNFDSSANWQELSGLATPQKSANSNYFWIISDSPANMLAAVSKTNASNQGVWTLQSPPTYVDWEDIEAATIGGQEYLYIFDFGNNGNSANSRGSGIDLRIFRAKEPTITGSGGQISSSDYIQIDAAFPGVNGPTLRDAECSIVDPDTGKIYIVIKRDAAQKVYSLDHAASYSGTQTLVYEGAMTSLPAKTTQPLTPTNTYCVDMAISPDGKQILAKNYADVYYFPRNPATQTIMQALQQSLVAVPSYVGGGYSTDINRKSHPNAEPQGEGIAFSKDGRDWYSNSEYLASEGATASRYPFIKYTRASRVPTTVAFQDGVSPTAGYAGTSDTYIWDTNPGTNYGADTSMVVDYNITTETDQRKALLKFDLSSIPTTATIISAKLDLYVNTEGQGVLFYKMLTNWTESSTYTSLTSGVDNDGVEATAAEDAVNGYNLDTYTGTMRTNMLVSTVQGWVSNPSSNNGWLIEPLHRPAGSNGDGVQFDASEGVTAARHPKLTIMYY